MLIFLLEVAVAVLAVLFQDWVRDKVKEFFENNIKSYRDDIDLQNLIDSLQKIVSSLPVAFLTGVLIVYVLTFAPSSDQCCTWVKLKVSKKPHLHLKIKQHKIKLNKK